MRVNTAIIKNYELMNYRKITSGLPKNIKYWPGFGNFEKELAKEKVKTTEPDYYHEVLPEWMQMISIMGDKEYLDSEVAHYLQETARSAWR
jgi:hypothetical protein